MLRDIGMKQHPLTEILEDIFGIVFILSRVEWGSFVIAWAIFDVGVDKCPLGVKALLVIFQSLNYYWTHCLIKMYLFRIKNESIE